MFGLYPEIHPHSHYHFAVDELHQLYVEECGNPKGIPVVFLQDSAQGPQVYVRLPDGQVRPRSVQVGETQDGKVEIRAGLAEGEMLMTPPL